MFFESRLVFFSPFGWTLIPSKSLHKSGNRKSIKKHVSFGTKIDHRVSKKFHISLIQKHFKIKTKISLSNHPARTDFSDKRQVPQKTANLLTKNPFWQPQIITIRFGLNRHHCCIGQHTYQPLLFLIFAEISSFLTNITDFLFNRYSNFILVKLQDFNYLIIESHLVLMHDIFLR